MKLNVVMVLSLFSCTLYALSDDIDRQQIEDRIQPVGQVHVQADNTSAPVASSAPAEVQKEPGQATYEQYCIACHRDGVAGAPKFHDANDWNKRMAGKKIDDLVAVAVKGLNAMPPKGSCADCSEADLSAAIRYMMPKK